FFSSRRRHTRWPRDWSSDVCSSDLRGVLLNHHHQGITGSRKQQSQQHQDNLQRPFSTHNALLLVVTTNSWVAEKLLQLRVLGLGLLQDGNVGVGVQQRVTEPSPRISASSAGQYHSSAGTRQAVRSGR